MPAPPTLERVNCQARHEGAQAPPRATQATAPIVRLPPACTRVLLLCAGRSRLLPFLAARRQLRPPKPPSEPGLQRPQRAAVAGLYA
jgi:hypothetical protein